MEVEIQGYRDLSEHLRLQIENGEYPSGSMLPTELQMSKMYFINRHTVRAALKELETDGYITRVRGKGTRVTCRKISYAISQETCFTDRVEKLGFESDMKVIGSVVVPASTEVAELLQIAPKDNVVMLELVRYLDDAPCLVTTSFLPAARFEGLGQEIYTDRSLYRILRNKFGVEKIRRSWSEIECDMPQVQDRELLLMPLNLPVLIVRSLVKDGTGNSIEYCITRNRGDFYNMRVDLEKIGGGL